MADLDGTWDDLFVSVPLHLAHLLEDGDVGGSVAVLVDGEPVVDVRGGWTDAARTGAWGPRTLTNLWSVTKTLTVLCVHVLADRGELDLDAPVARYWPQFAAAGKEGVLVRHVLAHTAGLPDWEGPVEELHDWDAATARLAALAPQWEPGTAAGYHSLTQGFLLGEVLRRVTGASVGQFLAAEVAGPLGADVHLGLDPADDGRVALSVPPPGLDESWTTASSVPGPVPGTPLAVRDGNALAWRRAEVPAASGFGDAASVALVNSVFACGGTVRGVRVLSEQACARAVAEEFAGVDRRLGGPARWTLGLGVIGECVGWGAWGGSLVVSDPAARMTVAYVTNQMREPAHDTRGMELVMAAYDGLQGG